MVIDFRIINTKKTIDDRYPFSTSQTIWTNLDEHNTLQTLDFASGFHQIEMLPNSVRKTAFSLKMGTTNTLEYHLDLKTHTPPSNELLRLVGP